MQKSLLFITEDQNATLTCVLCAALGSRGLDFKQGNK